MTEGFNFDRNKFKKLLLLHITMTVLFCLSVGARCYYTYLGGYNVAIDNSYSDIVLSSFLVSLMIIAISGLAYLIVPAFLGIEYYFYSSSLLFFSVVIVYFFFSFLPDRPLQTGFYKYAENTVNIKEIQEWLKTRKTINYDSEDPSFYQFETVAKQDWPDSISAFNPDAVKLFEINSSKYVRLVYHFGLARSVGVCVIQEGVDVPLDDYYETGPRLPLQENAFIWIQ